MPEGTPGPEGTPAGTVVVPPPEGAATLSTPPPVPVQPPPPAQDQDVQPTLEAVPATPEEFRARLEAERKKTLDEVRAKAGAENGWMSQLAPEDREFLKSNPWALREIRAKLEVYERMPTSAPSTTPPPPESDPADEVEKELAYLHENRDAYEAPVYAREVASRERKLARLEAERVVRTQGLAIYEQKSREQQFVELAAKPEMKDPRFKRYWSGVVAEHDGKIAPLAAFDIAKQEFPFSPTGANGHAAQAASVPPTSKATPAIGEGRTIASSGTQPSLSVYERFARTPSGRQLDGKTP